MAPSLSRRAFLATTALALGCGGPSATPDLVWGRRGVSPGDLIRPRAIAITPDQHLYLIDFTARIQAYDADGKFLKIGWQTPDFRNGRPSGLGIALNGDVIVCDSHYYSVRICSPTGEEKLKLGGNPGNAPGEFGYVSDVVQAKDGSYFVSEFGANERITHLDAAGKLLNVIGDRGGEPGQFNHVRALALAPDGSLFVADACNHRLQIFAADGKLIRTIGSHGDAPGQFVFPYDLAFGPKGDLYVVEYGGHRVQKLTPGGVSLGIWGGPGRAPGKLSDPWALAVDARDRVHVVDTGNHRVQRIRM